MIAFTAIHICLSDYWQCATPLSQVNVDDLWSSLYIQHFGPRVVLIFNVRTFDMSSYRGLK